jgi:hypothetical protein
VHRHTTHWRGQKAVALAAVAATAPPECCRSTRTLSEGAAAGLSSRCSWALTGARRALHEAEAEEEEEEAAEEEEAPIVRPSTPSTTGARNTPTWCQRW